MKIAIGLIMAALTMTAASESAENIYDIAVKTISGDEQKLSA